MTGAGDVTHRRPRHATSTERKRIDKGKARRGCVMLNAADDALTTVVCLECYSRGHALMLLHVPNVM